MTWIVRGDGSRRRRGRDLDSPWAWRRRRGWDLDSWWAGRGAAAAGTWIVRGRVAAPPRLDRPWARRGAAAAGTWIVRGPIGNAPSLPDKLRGLDVSRFPGGALDDLGQALREASETVSHEVTRRREADATEARTCVVCLENDRDVVFMPCFHMVSCWACGLRVSECPTCRAPIDQKRRVYQ